MTKDAKHRFFNKLEKMAEALYRLGDSIFHNDAWEMKRSFIQGYGDAGKTVKLLAAEEIQAVIDRAHELVYSEGRVSRIERLKPIRSGIEEIDWDIFDSHSYERTSGANDGAQVRMLDSVALIQPLIKRDTPFSESMLYCATSERSNFATLGILSMTTYD